MTFRICDRWQVTCNRFFLFANFFWVFLFLALVSAHDEIFIVSCMWFFLVFRFLLLTKRSLYCTKIKKGLGLRLKASRGAVVIVRERERRCYHNVQLRSISSKYILESKQESWEQPKVNSLAKLVPLCLPGQLLDLGTRGLVWCWGHLCVPNVLQHIFAPSLV